MDNVERKPVKVSFAALNPYLATNIVSSKEEDVKGKDFIVWGERNLYPQYLWKLSQEVTVLRTIINAIADYTVGENVRIKHLTWAESVNKDGDTAEEIVRNCALDLARYGGFALNVVRNKAGQVAAVYYLDFKDIRSDKKNKVFYYSEDWDKQYGRVKYTTYNAFDPEGRDVNSIYYYKNSKSTTYPIPRLAGDAAIAAETERNISEFHLNSLKNGFSSNVIINFNNGQPTDEEKEEIERNLCEKFGGFQNAGRIMASFNDSKEQMVTVSKIDAADFGDRYNALAKSTKQDIYSAFQAHPVLFGLPTEGTGFNDQDFKEAFKLFNKTVILPMQKVIKQAFEKILGKKEIVSFEPFNIDWTDEGEVETVK